MTFGVEFHAWHRPGFETTLFDFEACLGFVTLFWSRALLSDVLRSLRWQLAEVRSRLNWSLDDDKYI